MGHRGYHIFLEPLRISNTHGQTFYGQDLQNFFIRLQEPLKRKLYYLENQSKFVLVLAVYSKI